MSYIIISATTSTGLLLLPLLLALSSFPGCDSYYSIATYYGSPDSFRTPAGACGYGDFGRTALGGSVSGVSRRFFGNGTGCGACYQLTCDRPNLCSYDGASVVVTDSADARRGEFVLTAHAYGQLARPRLAQKLVLMGVVPVEYQRIPCRYPGYNLHVKVLEESEKDEYLAIVILYQGGAHRLSAVELLQEELGDGKSMRNAFGCVWDTPNPPFGALSLRLQLLADDGGHRSLDLTDVLPDTWEPGKAYDAKFQLY